MTREMSLRLAASGLIGLAVGRLAADGPRPERAPRPASWPRETTDAFFPDAAAHLAGERPESPPADRAGRVPSDAAAGGSGRVVSAAAWSRCISAAVLEAEVKRLVARLRSAAATPPPPLRHSDDPTAACAELALWFAVIAKFDGEVRWRAAAPQIRHVMAEAARELASGQGAKKMAADALAHAEGVLRGERPTDGGHQPAVDDWSAVVDRGVAMRRMQAAWNEGIQPQLSDAAHFRRSADALRHEAQVTAALAQVIRQRGYDGWDDDAFVAHAEGLQTAARALDQAIGAANFAQAVEASGRMGQACAACHDEYRG